MATRSAFAPSTLPLGQRRAVRSRTARCSASTPSTSPVPEDEKKVESKVEIKECPGCGRSEGIAPGCDGAGRVIGGLGAVVDWWPIKAYKPCSYLVSAKKSYARKGQSLDEIAFGRKK